MTYHIDPTVEVTAAQRATIERCNLTVTEEFGHVVVRDELVLRQFGKSQGTREGSINDAYKGRVHGPANTVENMVEQMAYMHDLAVRDVAQRGPVAEGAHPGPSGAGTAGTALSGTYKTRRAASVRRVKAATVAAALIGEAVANKAVGETVAVAAPEAQGARKGGVIGALVALLSDGTKRTRDELYTALVEQFPDRASAAGGMRVTIGVQLGALKRKGHNIVTADKRFWIE